MKRRFYHLIKTPPQLFYALGLGPIIGRFVLLLTTTGRKTGLPRTTPLQYEEIDNLYYVASATGTKADWYRNLVSNPKVEVRVKRKKFTGTAETTTDPSRIADFLAYRLKRHPRMIGAMLRANGYPPDPTRELLEEYAAERALVIIHPT